MKKPLSIILVVALLLVSLGLIGCGGTKKGATETTQPATQESLDSLLAKSRNLPGITYDYVMTLQEGQMTGKMWVSGPKMKTETTMHDQKIITILDGVDNVAYTYMPEQNMAMKIAFDPAKAAKAPDQFSKEIDPVKAKVLETTTYDGVRCKVLLTSETADKVQTKMWLREDYGLPMRVEVTEAGANKMVMEYKNLQVGPLAADAFKLPAGVPVTDMSELLNKLPQMH